MDSKKITFANFLKDVRNKRNLTQEELANLSFINKKLYQIWKMLRSTMTSIIWKIFPLFSR
ncbi:MAG: hypothetical protein SOW41_04085 [Anaerococcus sp.]|nr:hypothetical protein [Anaerococcus sp.]